MRGSIERLLLSAGLALLVMAGIGCGGDNGGWFGASRVEGNDPRSRQINKHIIDMQANSAETRADAARQLGDMDAEQEASLNALAKGLRDPDRRVQEASARALQQIDTYGAVKRLRDASQDGYQVARAAYLQEVHDLRQDAQNGDAQAIDWLKRLGEKNIHGTPSAN